MRAESKLQALVYALIITVVVVCVSVHATAYFFRFFDDDSQASVILVSLIVPALLAPPASYVYAVYSIGLIDTQKKLVNLAMIDPLTGLYNRRALSDRLNAEMSRAERTGASVAVLMIDIDHFRNVNNNYGHAAGDAALRAVAVEMLACFRAGLDSVGRWGGEEFIVVMAETDLKGAAIGAERLRKSVEAMRIDHDGGQIGVTISIGAAALTASDTDSSVVARADDCLFAAKRKGRNQVVAARPAPAAASAPVSVQPLSSERRKAI